MAPREPLWRRYMRFFGPDPRADADDEIAFHLDRLEEDFRARGLEPDAARAAARARFGDPDGVRGVLHAEGARRLRRARQAEWFDAMGQDVHYALRRLGREPAFSLAVVSVLALGIGAATGMFSTVDAALLRHLPFPRSEALVVLRGVSLPLRAQDFRGAGGKPMPEPPFRPVEIGDVVALDQIFSHVAAYATGGLNLDDPERPVRVRVGVVSADFFATLGVTSQAGRTWLPEDGAPDAEPVMLLSYRLWQAQFGGGTVVGRRVSLSGRRYTVVGVMPPGFEFPDASDVWIPLSVPITPETFQPFRGFLPSTVVARIRAGTPREVAVSRLTTLWERRGTQARSAGLPYNLDDTIDRIRRLGAVAPLRRELSGELGRELVILLGATGLLLLIACANVANLLLAHATARRRELAVRAVLGATRGRITRQLLTESVVLAAAGGAAGVAVARLVLIVARQLMPAALLSVAPPHLDLRVLGFDAIVVLLTGLAFGSWPAIGAGGAGVGEAIKAGGGWGGSARDIRSARRVLVAAELGIALTLLVGAGLMLRSLAHVLGADPGLDTSRVATLELSFGDAVPAPVRVQRVEEVLARLDAIPGVAAAGVVNDLPLGEPGGISLRVELPDGPTSGVEPLYARYLIASSGYFPALRIPLLEGRLFDAADDSSAHVVIVNQSLARLVWPGVDAVGRPLRTAMSSPFTIVGVVGDVRESSLEEPAAPQMYFPMNAMMPATLSVVVRGSLPPTGLLSRLREAVRATDPSQAVYNVRTMENVADASLMPRRTNTLLIVLFGALALLLASIGVYAVVRHAMTQRTRELGIRIALGASGADLVVLIAREMLGTVVVGLALGIFGAWSLSRVLAGQLYEVGARDSSSFVLATAVLLASAALATLLPARRVLRLNPMDVIRTE